MVAVILLVVLTSCICWIWRRSGQVPGPSYGWSAILRLACVIATIRIGALWLGVTGLQHSDWPQITGYFLLILGLPDIYIVKAARGEPQRWAILGSLTLAATSVGWSAAFLWLANRLSANRELKS